MRVTLTESPELLAARAGELLRSHVEHNVLATVLENALAEPRIEPPLFGFVEDEAEAVIAVGARLAPRLLLASLMSDEAAQALLTRWLITDPELPGVAGPRPGARSLAAAWERLTGGTATLEMTQALHVLEQVTAPATPAPGYLREARIQERGLLVTWGAEFLSESGVDGDPESMIEMRLDVGCLHVWEDKRPVSLVGSSVAVAGTVRIGPVYTPPSLRGRGYASSAVAARSQAALDAGAERCLLHTDLANPTSNRIYAALGYCRVAEWEDVLFT